MSIYNSCKQTLELQQKDEDLLVMEDQSSILNETIFRNFDIIDRLRKELDAFKMYYAKKRTNLSFGNIVNVDVPPTHHGNSSPTEEVLQPYYKNPWPDP